MKYNNLNTSFQKTVCGVSQGLALMKNCFCGMVDRRKALALFPAGTIVRDPDHRESPTRHEQDLNLRRT